MAESADPTETRIVTDRDKIEILAEKHEMAPVEPDRGDEGFGIEDAPDDADERSTWEQFFGWFEDTDQVVRYRPPEESGGGDAEFELVGHSDGTGASGTGDRERELDDAETESIATGDTGQDAPPAVDTKESEPSDDERADDPSVAAERDGERGPTAAADDLALDEIHEDHAGLGDDLDDEYVVFQNEGDERIDLSGYVVRNEDGRSYEFSDGTTIDPGERLTLQSGTGADSEHERYWDAEEPVWGERGNTVLVETPDGERALRVPFGG